MDRFTPTLCVDAAGLVMAAAFGVLAASSHAPPVPLPVFFSCMSIAWLAFGAAIWRFAGDPGSLPVMRVVAWCVVLRVIGLWALPVLEDDFYRYLWDGRSLVVHGTPYGVAPMAAFSDPSIPRAFQSVLDGINHPDLPTIYGPVSEMVFGLGYLVSPASLWPIKLVLLIAEAIALGALARLGGQRAFLIFASCPLVIHESAFNAHPEAIGVAFMLVAFWLVTREKYAWAGVAMAMAAGSRAIALVLLPLLLSRVFWRADLRRSGTVLAAFGVTLAGLYLPFIWGTGSTDLPVLLQFSQAWEFNSTGYAVAAAALGDTGARIFAALVLTLVLGIVIARDRQECRAERSPGLPRGDWLLGTLFLVSPVVNPWYLLWLLPFVASRPTRWGFTAMAVVSLSYVHGLFLAGLPAYHHPVWVRPAEIALVGIAVWLDMRGALEAQVGARFFDEDEESSPMSRKAT